MPIAPAPPLRRRAGGRTAFVLLAVVAAVALAALRVASARADLWLPGYLGSLVDRKPTPAGTRHVLFLFVDHYEPGRGEEGVRLNREWLARWREFADRHRDSTGRRLQHTWFYAYDHHNDALMPELAHAVYDGYGEIELHWHHGNDTNESFPPKLAAALAWFRSYGALVSADGRTAFGFIHGNWALDGAGPPERCGVTRELTILKQAGCYADFTFPAAGNAAQPRKVNSIYYAFDDDRPKSYDSGVDAVVGTRPANGFLLVEGPIALKWGLHVTDSGAIEVRHEASPERVDRWVQAGIGVKGRPEWVFVKAYTHGIQGRNVVFSEETDRMLQHLEERYGRGDWRLHYVTAREAYNVIRAAEDGRSGDPEAFRNYELPPPINSSRLVGPAGAPASSHTASGR
jgi:hypothetical protein